MGTNTKYFACPPIPNYIADTTTVQVSVRTNTKTNNGNVMIPYPCKHKDRGFHQGRNRKPKSARSQAWYTYDIHKGTPLLNPASIAVKDSHQHTTQHFHPPPCPESPCVLPLLPLLAALRCDDDGTPSRISMLARVAASNTSSTPSILSAEHSL